MPSEFENSSAAARAAKGRSRPSALNLVIVEILRTLGNAIWLPWLALRSAQRRDDLLEEVRGDLKGPTPPLQDRPSPRLNRSPGLFISCAEASGETHARNFVLALNETLDREGAPAATWVGLGGPGLAGEGVRTCGDPVSQARMGFKGILGALPFYLRLVYSAARELRSGKVELFVGVDSPALNIPLAHMAKRCGLHTVQFITPQYWGWAPWRVVDFRECVDLGLSILPFEAAWFERRGVRVEHVGHPLLDELEELPEDSSDEPTRRRLAILPGSRRSVIARNLPTMLEALARNDSSEWELVICQSSEAHRELVESCVAGSALEAQRVELSFDLEAQLARADAALSVSGTILLHLLHHDLPVVVLYRLESSFQEWMGRHFLTVPWFSSVNLLAGNEVYPEFGFCSEEAPATWHAAVQRLLSDPEWRRSCRRNLRDARQRLGPPGACGRAAVAALRELDPALK